MDHALVLLLITGFAAKGAVVRATPGRLEERVQCGNEFRMDYAIETLKRRTLAENEVPQVRSVWRAVWACRLVLEITGVDAVVAVLGQQGRHLELQRS